MLLVLAITTTIFNIYYSISRAQLSAIFWGVALLLFVIPHTMHSILMNYPTHVINEASAFVMVTNFLYLVTRFLLDSRSSVKCKTAIDIFPLLKESDIQIRIANALFLLSIIMQFVWILITKGSLLDYTWSDGLGIQNPVMIISKYLIISFGAILFISLARKNYLFFLTNVFVSVIYLFIFRSRYDIIPLAMPFLIYFLLSMDVRKIMKSLLIGFIIILFVFFLQQYRYLGSLNEAATKESKSQLVGNTIQFIVEGKGEFSLIKSFYKFIEEGNQFPLFGEGRTYKRLALFPIPTRFIRDLKPRDFAMDMYEAYYNTKTEIGTMHPTIYGDLYANFGRLGCVMGIFYAVLLFIIDKYAIERAKPMSLKIFNIGIWGTTYTLLARGAVYNSITNGIWSTVLVFLIYFATEKLLSLNTKNSFVGKAK